MPSSGRLFISGFDRLPEPALEPAPTSPPILAKQTLTSPPGTPPTSAASRRLTSCGSGWRGWETELPPPPHQAEPRKRDFDTDQGEAAGESGRGRGCSKRFDSRFQGNVARDSCR
jgi:hypothetical protein